MDIAMNAKCPLCESAQVRRVRRSRIEKCLKQCRQCELFFCDIDEQVNSYSAGPNSVVTEDAFTTKSIENFKKVAEVYAALSARRYEYLSAQLERKQFRMLEIGCGIAGGAANYERLGVEYTGIDIDERMVAAARARGMNVRKLDVYELAPTEFFDVIAFSQVLEHIRAPRKFMEKVSSHLSKDGIVLCDVPNHNSLSGDLSRISRSRTRYGGIEPPHHSFSYSRKTLAELFRPRFKSLELLTASPRHPLWGQANRPTGIEAMYYRLSELMRRESLLVYVGRLKSD